jgi:hypothetical protein
MGRANDRFHPEYGYGVSGNLPPWSQQKGRLRTQNRRSRVQERNHASSIGGRVQAGSGSSWRAPGDVRSGEYLDELKTTDRRSFSLTDTIIRKVLHAGDVTGRVPRLIIDFPKLHIRAVVTFEDL